MTPPLRSTAITAVSTLLRAAPSLDGALLLSASPFRACAFRLTSPPKVPAVILTTQDEIDARMNAAEASTKTFVPLLRCGKEHQE
jgi:hypothetical protein